MSEASEALGAASDALAAVGVDSPRLDAELLLSAATGWDRVALAAHPEAEVEPAAARLFGELVRRRLRHEPVAYLLGGRWFREIELAVDPRVLVPRPETELLVELALELAPRTALDVGTGSGAIALALAAELPGCEVVATDTSAGALEVACANASRLGLADRVRFEAGSLPAAGEFDLLLANLPYIAESDWATLPPDVREWEPREALVSGADGLDAIRALIAAIDERERTYARIAGQTAFAAAIGLELGEGQAPVVAELLAEAGFAETEIRRDLAGIERVVVGRR